MAIKVDLKRLKELDEEEKHHLLINRQVRNSGVFEAESDEQIHAFYEKLRNECLGSKDSTSNQKSE